LLIFLVVFVSGPAEAVFAPASHAELKAAVDACTVETSDGSCPIYGVTNGPIGDWDISRVTSLHSLFSQKSAFNQDLSNWNTSKVSSMYNTFYYAESFNQDLSKWDVSRVTSMYNMFHHGLIYNQPMAAWDVGKVTNMDGVFYNSRAFNHVRKQLKRQFQLLYFLTTLLFLFIFIIFFRIFQHGRLEKSRPFTKHSCTHIRSTKT
jgi:surface protein